MSVICRRTAQRTCYTTWLHSTSVSMTVTQALTVLSCRCLNRATLVRPQSSTLMTYYVNSIDFSLLYKVQSTDWTTAMLSSNAAYCVYDCFSLLHHLEQIKKSNEKQQKNISWKVVVVIISCICTTCHHHHRVF